MVQFLFLHEEKKYSLTVIASCQWLAPRLRPIYTNFLRRGYEYFEAVMARPVYIHDTVLREGIWIIVSMRWYRLTLKTGSWNPQLSNCMFAVLVRWLQLQKVKKTWSSRSAWRVLRIVMNCHICSNPFFSVGSAEVGTFESVVVTLMSLTAHSFEFSLITQPSRIW